MSTKEIIIGGVPRSGTTMMIWIFHRLGFITPGLSEENVMILKILWFIKNRWVCV